MTSVADLWAMQTTDLAMEAIKHRLVELDKQRGVNAELQAARAAAAEAEAELARWRATQQELDRQSRELAEHIRSAEREMMSGKVRNPRELEGMEANVAALQRRRSLVEDESLAALLEIEQWQSEAQQRQARRASSEAAHAARQEAIKQEATQKLSELKKLSAQLNQQWQAVSPQDRELYKNLRTRKAGRALALEKNGACQACGLMLPTGAAQAVHGGTQRVFCPSCGRLLLAG